MQQQASTYTHSHPPTHMHPPTHPPQGPYSNFLAIVLTSCTAAVCIFGGVVVYMRRQKLL